MDTVNKQKNKSKIIIITTLALLSITAVGVIVLSVIQRNTITSLEKKVASLDNSANDNKAKSAKLSSENANLKEAVAALQKDTKITEDTSVPVIGREEPRPLGGTLNLVGLGRKQITVPANEQRGPISTDHTAVTVRIKNLSSVDQMYSTDSFTAVSNSGKVVRPEGFGPGIEQQVWIRSTLAPGGTEEVTLLFPIDQRLATLRLSIPDTSDQLTISLPAAS